MYPPKVHFGSLILIFTIKYCRSLDEAILTSPEYFGILKAGQHNVSIRIYHDVLRIQVTVDDTCGMQSSKRLDL